MFSLSMELCLVCAVVVVVVRSDEESPGVCSWCVFRWLFFFFLFFPFTFTLPFYCIGMQMRIWRVIDNHSVCFD